MAETLTKDQKLAVENRGGRLLVSAAAGSGKTKVLVDRLMEYLTSETDPAELDEFLIITYTKAAASELRGKIAAKLSQRIAQEPGNRHLQQQLQRLYLTQISTVHGFCAQLLREYAYRLDIAPDFRVADETETQELRRTVVTDLLDRVYETRQEDPDFRAFADTQGMGRDDSALPELILRVYDSARCHRDPGKWLNSCRDGFTSGEGRDAGETPWGAFLLSELRGTLEGHISALEGCRTLALNTPGFEKAAANLGDILFQLEQLKSSETWDQAAARRRIDFGRISFPRKGCDLEAKQRIQAVRDGCKEALKKAIPAFTDDSQQLLSDMADSAPAIRGLCALVEEFDGEYRRAKRSRRVLDFGDLEHETLDLLLGKDRTGPTAVAGEVARRYREVLVDEYQDTNAVQDGIFSAITGERKNCFLVGDVKQSIYRFRLADPGIFLSKYASFLPVEEALPGEDRKVLLSDNFRSGGEIVEAVNHVFSACMSPQVGGLRYGEGEALREGISHTPLPDPGVELYVLETGEDGYAQEAEFAASRLREMLDGGTLVRDGDRLRPMTPQDVVILLRSPGSAGEYYRAALESRGIRCVIGGGTDLLKAREVEDMCALLRTVANPRQDIPLLSVLISPLFGFTAQDLAEIRAGRTKETFFDALTAYGGGKAAEFLGILSRLRQQARRGTLSELAESCFTLTRADSIYAALPGGKLRQENLRRFFQMICEYDASSGRSLGQFLEHLENLQTSGMMASDAGAGDWVTIMSIHRSKGLEFPVVFLCGLSRRFNMEDLRAQILCDPELGLGPLVADRVNRVRYPSLPRLAIAGKLKQEGISEEMRILYVAMTRAKDRLVMTCACKNPEKTLTEIALRMTPPGDELLCREAGCPADWLLLAAMGRTEAGALHALGGAPGNTRVSAYPWKIAVIGDLASGGELQRPCEAPDPPPPGAEERIRAALSFAYGHIPATLAPSKQTATGRKGREKDEEAAENTRSFPARRFRRPGFLGPETDGRARGNATHAAMRYLDYTKCAAPEDTARELDRLVREGKITSEQRSLTDPGLIAPFFDTPVGRKLRQGAACIREFKFSLLWDGEEFGEGLEGERVLLQGVVDCALMEEDGITVVDFKTDSVTGETVNAAAERYRTQVETYAAALSRIYEVPVKEACLYFFRLRRLVKL